MNIGWPGSAQPPSTIGIFARPCQSGWPGPYAGPGTSWRSSTRMVLAAVPRTLLVSVSANWNVRAAAAGGGPARRNNRRNRFSMWGTK